MRAPRDGWNLKWHADTGNATDHSTYQSDFFMMADTNPQDNTLTFLEIMDARMAVLKQMNITSQTGEYTIREILLRFYI